jgi:hypothetical protein
MAHACFCGFCEEIEGRTIWNDNTRAQYARTGLGLPCDLTDAESAFLDPFDRRHHLLHVRANVRFYALSAARRYPLDRRQLLRQQGVLLNLSEPITTAYRAIFRVSAQPGEQLYGKDIYNCFLSTRQKSGI